MRATNTAPQGQINAPDQLDCMSTLRTDNTQTLVNALAEIERLKAECEQLLIDTKRMEKGRDAIARLAAKNEAEIERLKGLLAIDSTSTLNDAMQEIERLQNFESDAKRLALELECLLMSTDLPAATKWWDSAHEALELHRKTIGQYYGEKL